MLTVGRLARKHGLSRSTLLYYDSIGLLSPSERCKGEYRRYTAEDERRLEQICVYRRAGVSLKDIQALLNGTDAVFASVLEQRFVELEDEILRLREQQQVIATLLKNTRDLPSVMPMTKELWISLLETSGFSKEDMRLWHRRFEESAPEKHEQFLRQLRIPVEEIAAIRAWSRLP